MCILQKNCGCLEFVGCLDIVYSSRSETGLPCSFELGANRRFQEAAIEDSEIHFLSE